MDERREKREYLSRITDKQREAMALSIELRLDAEESNDVRVLAEAADKLETAVRELESARRVLVEA